MSPVEIANKMERTVQAIMRDVIVPDIQQRLPEIVSENMVRVIQYTHPGLVERIIREEVRRLISDKISIEISLRKDS